MHQVVIGEWGISIESGSLPASYEWLVKSALLIDEVDLRSRDGRPLVVAAYSFDRESNDANRPVVVVAQTYTPHEGGFDPGVLIVPETSLMFIGAGTRLLAYDLSKPARLWEDEADVGFWSWDRSNQFVLMAAELEFAVWSKTGQKLWTTFVEPPWDYSIDGENVLLDVMGRKQLRRLADGTSVG